MHTTQKIYGALSSHFYEIVKPYASEQELDFYAAIIRQNPGRVLEAMSGTGRLQIPLSQRGFVVDGVDNSPEMLARCRERCAALNLAPEIYEQSLEDLSLPHRYATITIAIGSFQLIHDRSQAGRALKNLRMHLQEKGNLLIDTFVPKVFEDPVSVRVARVNERSVIRLTTRSVIDEKEKHADAFCTYDLIVDGTVQRSEQELMRVAWYTDQEFEQLCAQAGLKIVAIHEKTFPGFGQSRIMQATPADSE